MIIKCPQCSGQVSTMAGTCPHCGTNIAGQLRQCPSCGNYYLLSQQTCPQCNHQTDSSSTPQGLNEEDKFKPSEGNMKKTPTTSQSEYRMMEIGIIVKGIISLLLLCLLCVGGYQYFKHERQRKEQADYERLEGVTNPEFYQQFLIDHPKSEYYKEIEERMLMLQTEAEEWKQLQKNINRSNVSLFLQKHPNSLRQRACEDLLDSIDWQDALAIGNEEAITDYLSKHPSGRYVDDAAAKKNSLLLSKVTPEEKAMIRGTLESFFSKVIGGQDIEAAKAAIPDTMVNFCGKQNAVAETVIEYAKEKMAKDVIGLHYAIGQKMDVRKETLPDGNTGFAVEVSLHETISRSDTSQPSSNNYRVNALVNQEQKIVKLVIF